jgi:formylglycine-generating enzyme required for sulfatase activity
MQWEYGCRAGTTSFWWTGEDKAAVNSAANLGDDIASIGGLPANPFGLHDVHGNVWEWCGDTYDADAEARVDDGLRDDGVASSADRSSRGGSWFYSPENARSAYRGYDTPEYRYGNYGLRPSRRITP